MQNTAKSRLVVPSQVKSHFLRYFLFHPWRQSLQYLYRAILQYVWLNNLPWSVLWAWSQLRQIWCIHFVTIFFTISFQICLLILWYFCMDKTLCQWEGVTITKITATPSLYHNIHHQIITDSALSSSWQTFFPPSEPSEAPPEILLMVKDISLLKPWVLQGCFWNDNLWHFSSTHWKVISECTFQHHPDILK